MEAKKSIQEQRLRNIEITNYNSKYDQSFYELNKSWIEEFWMLEDSDLKDLLKPEESIIELGGGNIFCIGKWYCSRNCSNDTISK